MTLAGWGGHERKEVGPFGGTAEARRINHASSHTINLWGYREVGSEAATGTSPTETSGGWGTLHPSKQVSLPRGQHQQYPIHYKGQKEKEGGKQGGERNNKHLFTVTVVTFSPVFSVIYDQLLEKPCGGLIGLGGCRTGAPVRGVEFGQNYVE